jgi:hypothetical protein
LPNNRLSEVLPLNDGLPHSTLPDGVILPELFLRGMALQLLVKRRHCHYPGGNRERFQRVGYDRCAAHSGAPEKNVCVCKCFNSKVKTRGEAQK